ncbi:UNVERIFIED_ORG: hypothetical protein GGD58_000538 [Rhizobium pisi]
MNQLVILSQGFPLPAMVEALPDGTTNFRFGLATA